MKNALQHITEFEKLLKHYHLSVSNYNKQTLAHTKLLLLAGSTSSGRNTLVRELLKTGDFHFIVSDTTRAPRKNNGHLEQDGVEYWFRSEEDMLADLQAGKFLEAAIIHGQQVSGISIKELERANNEGKIAMTDIETVGVDTIMKASPSALALFVVPPSFEEWQRRLQERGGIRASELKRRMTSACQEFAAALERPYYIFIINDTVEHAVEQVESLARFSHIDLAKQDRARSILEKLYVQAQQQIAEL